MPNGVDLPLLTCEGLTSSSSCAAERIFVLISFSAGDPASADTETTDTGAIPAAPPTVVSKLVRGSGAGGSSGAQIKRSSRSAL